MAIPAFDLWLAGDDGDVDDGVGSYNDGDDDDVGSQRRISPDAEVVGRIRAGDVDAFEQVYRDNLRSLIAFGASILGNRDQANDVVATVFLEVWRQREAFEAPGGIRAYLYAAVRNRAFNELRSRGRIARWEAFFNGDVVGTAEGAPLEDERLEADERIRAVRRALDALPEPRRTICRLRFQEGMSFGEIGAALGLSSNAVQQQLSRARKLLREMLPALLE